MKKQNLSNKITFETSIERPEVYIPPHKQWVQLCRLIEVKKSEESDDIYIYELEEVKYDEFIRKQENTDKKRGI